MHFLSFVWVAAYGTKHQADTLSAVWKVRKHWKAASAAFKLDAGVLTKIPLEPWQAANAASWFDIRFRTKIQVDHWEAASTASKIEFGAA